MAAIRRLVSGPAQLPHVEGDEIYPVHIFDGSNAVKNYILACTFRFNDVLDPATLHSALSKLLEIGDWKKMGGRLRRNKAGKLEMHVPKTFTAERPGVIFTHTTFAVKIHDHPLARNLPSAAKGLSLQDGPSSFRLFAARPDAPATLEDFFCRDLPQLSLHITSFEDATLVALSWPHSLMDAMGCQSLLKAWSLIVSGRESEVPPVLGSHEDILLAAAEGPACADGIEPFKRAGTQLKGLSMVIFGLIFLWDAIWSWAVQDRVFLVPKAAVDRMRSQAQEEASVGLGPNEEKPFVSEGDVLTAWSSRLLAAGSRPRPVSIMSAIDLKPLLPSILEAKGVYIQNVSLGTFTFLSPETAKSSVGKIATTHRQQIKEQMTEPQVLGIVRSIADTVKGGDGPYVHGQSSSLLLVYSNWTKADFFNAADFSAAVVRQGESSEKRKNPPGTMSYFHSQTLSRNALARNVVIVYGKDYDGNYWITAFLVPKVWELIEESLKNLQT